MTPLTAAQARLVEEHADMPRRLAVSYWTRTLRRTKNADLDELAADGALGLVKAAAAFDSRRATKFETFAYMFVRGAIVDGQRSRSRAHGWIRTRGQVLTMYSLDAGFTREDDEPCGDAWLADDSMSPHDRAARRDLWGRISRALPTRERRIIALILRGAGKREIAQCIGLSTSRIDQLVRRATARASDAVGAQDRSLFRWSGKRLAPLA